MENLVKGEPTAIVIGQYTNMPTFQSGGTEAPHNITKIIENFTTIDTTGLEDAIKDLSHIIQSKPSPYFSVPIPSVTIEAPRTVAPVVNVTSPDIQLHPKIEINIETGWLFFAALIPTLAFLADIYVRLR